MSTVPTKQSSPPAATVEERFRRLEAIWSEEVGFPSSASEHCSHPVFREIISMGEAVVPLMLHDLEERPRLQFWALPEITGADPVPEGDAGNIRKISEAWLNWVREHHYR